jgi:hypothetical protein
MRFAALLGVVALAACGCSDDAGPPGTGGETGAGGSGGAGGASHGDTSGELVCAGDVVTSPNYHLVFSLGQSSQNQQTARSPSFRLEGGLVGAMAGSP